jgi:hypothetical protein
MSPKKECLPLLYQKKMERDDIEKAAKSYQEKDHCGKIKPGGSLARNIPPGNLKYEN